MNSFWAIALLLACVVVAGCAERPAETKGRAQDTRSAEIRRRHDSVRSRTRTEFDQAAFLSPAPESDVGVPLWMAPLIVQEFPSEANGSPQPPSLFGTITSQPSSVCPVDTARQTIYLLVTEVSLGSIRLKQWTYLWFYPPVSTEAPSRYRGVRMTIGSRGHAILWEVLSDASEQREIYVSKSLEAASRKQHGPPLPGRRFAVEPSLNEHPEIVVPRVINDGPQPMGPFVYLDAEQLAVTNLICRCEPSQVSEFPLSCHYRLERIEDISELPVRPESSVNLTGIRPGAQLERYLRLPSGL